ncbi:MAG: DNA polymerase [Gammaproteobacteria bacterium]|nr:DNA polymerase [Gammaproteobacteria bacterium]|tara:strand:+ start:22202 stop:23140 length:939 start_codon:yes stop_codon:yes gene_type:complete
MKEFLWVEKYRPQKIEDCILPKTLKNTFNEIIKGGELPNMMFTGTAGVGKTTVARALCNELGLDNIVVNGSEDGNIDTLRGKIKQFASTVSLQGGYKVVILDEADYLNPQSTQPALRGFIEEFSSNCRFILTCNFKNRIIEPLHSRCSLYDFNVGTTELKTQLKLDFMKRVWDILDKEEIKYENVVLAELIHKHFPDWRRVLNELQRYGMSGNIDAGILVTVSEENVKKLMSYLKDKDFKGMRKWVTENMDLESAKLFRMIYDNMKTYVEPRSIPALVVILADYSYKDSFMADHELNVVACLTEVMSQVKFV